MDFALGIMKDVAVCGNWLQSWNGLQLLKKITSQGNDAHSDIEDNSSL